jgi:hypothetical protein
VQGLTRDFNCEILKLQFPTPTVGFGLTYVSGQIAAIMKTEDGGSTWNLAGLLENEYARDGGIFFVDESNGVVLTKSGKSWITADGGQTWKGMIATNLGQEIRFADLEVGWSFADLCTGMGCENAKLSYTTDGGRRWASRSFQFPAGVQAFSLPRRDRGYAVGDHGMIYRYRVVPTTQTVAKSIAAPAMPVFDSPLDEQVAALEQQMQTLQDGVTDAEVTQIEATANALVAETPQFAGKLKNLNLIFQGFEVAKDLINRSKMVKDTVSSLRGTRDPAAIQSAVQQLTGQVTEMVGSTRLAFRRP